jgi:hypothetical protein
MKISCKSIFNIFTCLVLLVISLFNVTPVRAAAVHYVKANGTGDCSTWAKACKLQTALTKAVSGDEIWVAAGTHKPTTGTDRNISFVLKNGVPIYGGFSGTETDSSERNFKTRVTILSGNIGGSGAADNSYHVVTANNLSNDTTLDGFTISAGHAQYSQFNGGGLYAKNSKLIINNVIFSSNYAENSGGGMYQESSSNSRLYNVKFINNIAAHAGGIHNQSSSLNLENVVFKNNSVGGNGGGMINALGTLNIFNTTFDSNTATDGGALYNAFSSPSITNSTFYNNGAAGVGGGIFSKDGTPVLTSVTISNNYASSSGGGIYNWPGANFTVRNSILWGNTSPGNNQIINNATVTYSIVQGGYSGTGNLYLDPLLGKLSDNGGFTQTIPILENSSAINTGTDSFCPSKDQRGISRPKGLHCDIGAFEYTGVVSAIPPKVVSVTRVGTSPTNLPEISFTVIFSKPVDGVDTADFSLTTTGDVAASINDVNGSEATYTVTVGVASGNGTIRLDVNDDDTILDYALAPLGGAGSGNGNFTKGEVYTIERNRVVSILRANTNPTNASTVDFTVTFSGNETGVDASDFFLTTSGSITGVAINNISGSGNVYTVEVGTGSNDGTIRLDVVDDDSIVDDSPEPLGGTGVSNGDFTNGETYTIKRIANLSAPALKSPETKVFLNNPQPLFQWTEITGAQSYEVQFDDNNDFGSLDGNSSSLVITDTSHTVGSAFADGTYFWRVRAYNNSNQPGKWSVVRTFTIDTAAPAIPDLLAPADAEPTTKHTVTFTWSPSPSAALYEFSYDDTADCLSPIFFKTTNKTSIRPPAIPDGIYYWCVNAKDTAGNWSGVQAIPFTFTIEP